MALSPEDVLNKTFTTTQFRRGYDEREVDDFLDDIVAEMRRMTKTDEEVRKQLNDCRQGRGLEPVTAAMPAPAAVTPDRSAEIAKPRDATPSSRPASASSRSSRARTSSPRTRVRSTASPAQQRARVPGARARGQAHRVRARARRRPCSARRPRG